MTDRKTIKQATRERVCEVLEAELGPLANFTYLVTRKSIDLTANGKREVVVCGSSPHEHWNIVDAEVAKIYKRLTGKNR